MYFYIIFVRSESTNIVLMLGVADIFGYNIIKILEIIFKISYSSLL